MKNMILFACLALCCACAPALSAQSEIKDADNNTKVQTEKNANENIIRFTLSGNERMTLLQNTGGTPRLELLNPLGNTALGYAALKFNISGKDNTAVGFEALRSNTSGNYNTASGRGALYYNSTGYNNTANGVYALSFNTSGHDNTANGVYALSLNTTGNYNTASGRYALRSNTSGHNNTASGFNALYSNTTASDNTANGAKALTANTTGTGNTAVGSEALVANTTGNSNTANGSWALHSNFTGIGNTALGQATLASNSSGHKNTAVGVSAMHGHTTGSGNTAIGADALLSNTTGSNNTALGYQANVNSSALTNATAVGYGAIVNASNKIRLGNAAVTVVEGAMYVTSDGRFKSGIESDVPGLEFITSLRPVTYHFDYTKFSGFLGEKSVDKEILREKEQQREMGFVAQEVESACKKARVPTASFLHIPNNEDDNYSIAYSQLVVPLVKAVQEQQQQIAHLETRLAQQTDQSARIAELETTLKDLLSRIESVQTDRSSNLSLQDSDRAWLDQNIPNPFVGDTEIRYFLPEGIRNAALRVYSGEGRLIKELALTGTGWGSVRLQTNDLAAGLYRYTLLADGKLVDSKMMMVAGN